MDSSVSAYFIFEFWGQYIELGIRLPAVVSVAARVGEFERKKIKKRGILLIPRYERWRQRSKYVVVTRRR